MPKLNVNGATLHYESTGAGAETIVFLHGLLWSGAMYSAQVAALSGRYRCVTIDFRGQGQSEVTAGGYDMDTLSLDVIAVLRELGLGAVHLAGLSMGGFVAMRVGARRPDLVKSLVLLETSSQPEPKESIGKYQTLGFVGRWLGYGVVASQVMPIMFGKTFMADAMRKQERATWRATLIANDRVGIQRALGGVIGRFGVESELVGVSSPTLVIVGDEDIATPPPRARRIAELIAGSTLVTIPRAGHSSTIEEPAAVTSAIETFLDSVRARSMSV